MRRTKDGHLLLKIKKGPNAETAAAKFGSTLVQALGDKVDTVRQLGIGTEVEIQDIDPVTTKAEVHSALYNAAFGKVKLDQLAVADIIITGLWSTASDSQITTA